RWKTSGSWRGPSRSCSCAGERSRAVTQPSSGNALVGALRRNAAAPLVLAAVAFALLFREPFTTLLRDWWNDPDAGHGLLLGPLAIWLAWKSGLVAEPKRAVGAGLVVLTAAI